MKFRIDKSKTNRAVSEIFFDKNGVLTEEDETPSLYGKVVYLDDKASSYHVKVFQNALYDPLGPYGRREKYLETSFKKVSKNTFDFYMMYLKTNNSIYLTKAQRGFLND